MIDVMEYPEGATPLDPDEMEGLKFAHVTTRGELDHLEQANIEEGLIWVKRRRKGDLLDDQFLRQLHQKLFGDVWAWAGTYRKTEKNIGIAPFYISVQLRQLLDDVRYWVENGTYRPIEIAVRFHHKLVYIHPFPNGNGRFSRIIADQLLEERLECSAIDWSGGYDLQEMNERRKDYINALREADAGNYAPLLEFVG
ncbi:mobile mystery protein B [Zhongshania marina]|uniref:Mobile mystery protein B n=1 Tax=Zhongshania marina TaxID=2304603 RepID=A0ABX9W0C1_9GAMM|nr:mobile mystery protein B [Zhongshania marina]